jgi:hypothetical protein
MNRDESLPRYLWLEMSEEENLKMMPSQVIKPQKFGT